MIVDLFAGPGGWDEGLRRLDHDRVIGVELDEHATATARAAGHDRIVADVAELDPTDYAAPVLIASPPCPAFSSAGRRGGTGDAIDALVDGTYGPQWVHDRRGAWDEWETALDHHEATAPDPDAPTLFAVEQAPHPGDPPPDPRGDLIGEVGRWALAVRPETVVAEQVPPVLPLWEELGARVLDPAGYAVWTGILNAADYGVPQTRRRAFLIASRIGPATPPPDTHDERARHGRAPWRSIADELGPAVAPEWRYRSTRYPNSAIRPVDRPAPTVAFGNAYADCAWIDPEGRVVRRVELDEAARLQSFRPGYPWTGPISSRFLQVANAVPPTLAEAILRPIVG